MRLTTARPKQLSRCPPGMVRSMKWRYLIIPTAPNDKRTISGRGPIQKPNNGTSVSARRCPRTSAVGRCPTSTAGPIPSGTSALLAAPTALGLPSCLPHPLPMRRPPVPFFVVVAACEAHIPLLGGGPHATDMAHRLRSLVPRPIPPGPASGHVPIDGPLGRGHRPQLAFLDWWVRDTLVPPFPPVNHVRNQSPAKCRESAIAPLCHQLLRG